MKNTTISSSDSVTLYSITCSDPLLHGAGVYVARNILDWDGTCPTYGNKNGEQTSENNETILFAESFSIYPVPNKGEFKIEARETSSQMEIYDLQGKFLKVEKERKMESMSLSFLAKCL